MANMLQLLSWGLWFQSLEWLDTPCNAWLLGRYQGPQATNQRIYGQSRLHPLKLLGKGFGVWSWDTPGYRADRAIVARKGLRPQADSWNHISEARHQREQRRRALPRRSQQVELRNHPAWQEESRSWP